MSVGLFDNTTGLGQGVGLYRLNPGLRGGASGLVTAGNWLPAQYQGALFALDGDGSMSGVPGAAYLNGLYYDALSQTPNASITGGAGFATAVDASGNVVGPFASNTLPVTNAGAEIWEARTNALRNAIFGGASLGVVGSGGAMPTNMSLSSSSSQMTITLSETGVESGRPFIELRLQSASAPTSLGLRFETASGVPASAGQVWSAQNGVKFVGGSLSGVGVCYPQIETFGGSSSKQGDSVTLSPQLQNLFATHTMPVGCTNLRSQLIFTMTPGAAVDFTVRVYAPQLELGSFPTPYIPTTSAAATRTALDLSLALSSQSQGTLFAEFLPRGVINSMRIADLNDATGNNRVSMLVNAGATVIGQVVVGGVDQAVFTTTPPSLNSVSRIAIGFAANDFAASINGAAPITDTSGSVPTFSQLEIGKANSLGGNRLNGQMRRLIFIPSRLSNAQLQALTA